MSVDDVPLGDVWYYFPSDIKVALLGILAFLLVLAVWRIIK